MTKERQFCWSCGQPPGNCSCGEPVISRKIDMEIPDVCGVTPLEKLDLSQFSARPALRPCCSCGKPYTCTPAEWSYGTCPHCGANGTGSGTNLNKILRTREN